MASYGALPFQEAIDFFRAKDLVPTERWADLWKEQHDIGFMVAGAAKADLLADLKGAVDKAIAEGTTLATFREDFDRIVAKHGWTGWTGEGTESGVAWRTKVIYDTNLRAAYQAGRWAQVQRVKDRRPYLLYRHSDSVTTPRPLHLSWNGLVIPADDPWWQAHWPPNGWGCKCKAFSLNVRDLQKMGKTGPDTPPDDGTRVWVDQVTGERHVVPNGIDPGWDYAPGASRTDLLGRELARKEERLAKSLAGEDGPAKTIDLKGIEADSVEGIREVLVKLKNLGLEQVLPHGVRDVKAIRDVNTISDTNQRGWFGIGAAPVDGLGGKSGLEVMTSALAKARDGVPLEFEEEYGLESLWHEILHNAQQDVIRSSTPPEQIRLMEGLHQVLARQTYPRLLRALGIDPKHLRQVRESGPAYPKSAGGMTALLRAAGLMDADFALADEVLAALLQIDRESPLAEILTRLASAISGISGLDKGRLQAILERIANGEPMASQPLTEWLKP